MTENIKNTLNQAYLEIQNFPKAKNWKPYLTLKNWRKIFFDIFIKKYWLNWGNCKYSDLDVLRRVRITEFFWCFLKKYDLKFESKNSNWKNIFTIKSVFYKMVILETWWIQNRFELLSFYHYK